MKYALITTFESEQPYRFCEVLDQKIEGDFPGVIWVEIPDDLQVAPKTHRYTGEGFVECPIDPLFELSKARKAPVDPAECTSTEQPTVL